VWTEVFLWIERKIEGDRRNQMKLDKKPWTGRKVAIKATKHGIWILFSLWTGFTFVGFFTPVLDLGARVMTLELGPWETFWILFYGFATYGNAGWMREQVCLYMCPYARFQSAMFDNDTLVISYDSGRGEARGARKRSTDYKAAGLGDCIDCTMCVQVCPTGIDIRDGLQHQCIACAACVDACDTVMGQMGYHKGLIRYTTENALSGKQAKILRPRIIAYAFVLISLVVAVGVGLAGRTPLGLDVIRDRSTLFRDTDEGLVENVYTLKLINMDSKDHLYEIAVSGIDGMELSLDADQVPVAAHEVLSVSARVRADPYSLERASSTIVFTLQAIDDDSLRVDEEARFLGPVSPAR
jgi:cytochrome c oxidase accessory protein FixG